MKIENIELTRITKTDIETKEEEKTLYTAIFEDKEKSLKISISQDEEFNLVVGEKYDFNLGTEQKKL